MSKSNNSFLYSKQENSQQESQLKYPSKNSQTATHSVTQDPLSILRPVIEKEKNNNLPINDSRYTRAVWRSYLVINKTPLKHRQASAIQCKKQEHHTWQNSGTMDLLRHLDFAVKIFNFQSQRAPEKRGARQITQVVCRAEVKPEGVFRGSVGDSRCQTVCAL